MPNRRSICRPMPVRSRSSLVRSPIVEFSSSSYTANQQINETDPYTYIYSHQPKLNVMNKLAFEAFFMLYLLFAMMAQYIYIFKTVWWYPSTLPPSSNTINFHLIDKNITIFVVFLFSKRFLCALLWNFFMPVTDSMLSSAVWIAACAGAICVWLFQLGGYILLLLEYINCCSLILLLCPLFFWFPYNFFIEKGTLRYIFNIVQKKAAKQRFQGNIKLPNTLNAAGEALNGVEAKQVRQKVEELCQDFNARFAEIVFYSLSCAYYAGLVPMYFTKSYHSYNFFWSFQHTALVLTNCFIMLTSFLLPTQYLQTLNESATRLGGYMLVRDPMTIVDDINDVQDWSASTVFPRGCFVRYKSNTYRACGKFNTAIPDDRTHAKFFMLFYKPLKVINWLLVALFAVVCYQIYVILWSSHWDHVVAPAILQFFSYYILRTVLRDRIVLSTFFSLNHDV